MLAALGPVRLRSSGAHCDPDLAKRIGEKRAKRIGEILGEEDWQEACMVKRIGETLGKKHWRGGGDGKEEEEKDENQEQE